MKRKKMLVIVSMIMISLLIGMGVTVEAKKATFLTMGGGTEGGTYELMAAAIAIIIEDEIPEARITVIPGGSVANPTYVGQGRAEMGISTCATIYDAFHGEPPFKSKIEKLRGVCGLFPQVWQLVALESSGIKKIEDLVSHTYCPAEPGQISYFHSESILELHGIPFEDFKEHGGKVIPLGFGEVRREMKDKIIEATAWTTSVPQPGYEDVATMRKIRMIGIEKGMLDKYVEKYHSYSAMSIPAGTYTFQPEEIQSVGTICCFFMSSDISEELGFRITKAVMDNLNRLHRTHVGTKYLTLDTAPKGFKIPLHPGAERYYREIGVLR